VLAWVLHLKVDEAVEEADEGVAEMAGLVIIEVGS
jgi:hypothetical protein